MFLYFPVTITGASLGISAAYLLQKYISCVCMMSQEEKFYTHLSFWIGIPCTITWKPFTIIIWRTKNRMASVYSQESQEPLFKSITSAISAQFKCLFMIDRPLEVFCFYKQSWLLLHLFIILINMQCSSLWLILISGNWLINWQTTFYSALTTFQSL